MGSDGSLHKRKAINGSSLPNGVRNYVITELDNDPHLFVRTPTAVQFSTGEGFAAVPFLAAASGGPVGGGAADAASRGSFAIHAGEVYYCDPRTVWAWDAIATGARRPGIESLDGQPYTAGQGVTPNLGLGQATISDYGPPFGEVTEYPGQTGSSEFGPHDPALDPYIIPAVRIVGGDGALNDADRAKFTGEKTLNTAFALSYYDPIRKIYGHRSEAFALPYIFSGGGTASGGPVQLLSNARAQYSKVVSTPAVPTGRDDYKVAIWFTRGFTAFANTSQALNGGWFVVNFWAPAMSTRMNDLLFLEGIFEANKIISGSAIGATGVICKKDDTTLFSSGRYLDIYARPVPSRFMMILANGVGIYFFPRSVPTRLQENTVDNTNQDAILNFPLGNYAEYSVGHPEQIGRNTDTQRDTVSNLPNLKGFPLQTISDGTNQLLLTSQAVYRVGFDGGVILSEITGGRGVRAASSISQSAQGTLWMGDEGVIWLRGGKLIVLDQQIGFGDWYEGITITEREAAVIGAADSLGQILVFSAGVASGASPVGDRALCYDADRNFVSEFRGGDITGTDRAIFFRGTAGGHLWTNLGRYPGTSTASQTTEVELWASEEVNRPKTAEWLTIDLGSHTPGSLTVRVTAYDHEDGGIEFLTGTGGNERTATIPAGSSGNRFRLEDFIGMRGRMFRIRLEGGTGLDWELQKVRFEFHFDDEGDAHSL